MNEWVKVYTVDGFSLPMYRAKTKQKAKGGIVIIQEIFGVTAQLKEIAEQYCALGYDVIIPALFSRVSNELELEYNQAKEGISLVEQCDQQNILIDIQAAVIALNHKQVSVIGFCWGGGLAYLAASELKLYSAIAYYGTRLLDYLPRKPKCPFQFHFGESDKHSPPELIQELQLITPESEFHIYSETGHAFANHHKASFNKNSATLAHKRVSRFLPQ
jgi:carboxymethylenebutenolidase